MRVMEVFTKRSFYIQLVINQRRKEYHLLYKEKNRGEIIGEKNSIGQNTDKGLVKRLLFTEYHLLYKQIIGEIRIPSEYRIFSFLSFQVQREVISIKGILINQMGRKRKNKRCYLTILNNRKWVDITAKAFLQQLKDLI